MEPANKSVADQIAEMFAEGCVSGERVSEEKLRAAMQIFEQQPLLRTFLDAVPCIVVVLNEKRQIVYANRRLLQVLGCRAMDGVCGLRPGEVFNCAHASEAPEGCGTTEFCRTCGAVKAILGSLLGTEMVEECRILRSNNDALEFRVWTTPILIDGQRFTIFAVTDITHEKRRETLEYVLFHDLLNLAGTIHGFCDYLGEAPPEELDKVRQVILRLTSRLAQEIRSHQLLLAAERGDLTISPFPVSSLALLQQVAEEYRQHPVASEREIVVDPVSRDVEFVTDANILLRVLENMLKNALEATAPGERVTLRCYPDEAGVCFEVHNPGVIPREVQLQIFVRSYSTKGQGRGLGTYGMKLFTERYLGGQVSFESSPETGTTFRVTLPVRLPDRDS